MNHCFTFYSPFRKPTQINFTNNLLHPSNRKSITYNTFFPGPSSLETEQPKTCVQSVRIELIKKDFDFIFIEQNILKYFIDKHS